MQYLLLENDWKFEDIAGAEKMGASLGEIAYLVASTHTLISAFKGYLQKLTLESRFLIVKIETRRLQWATTLLPIKQ